MPVTATPGTPSSSRPTSPSAIRISGTSTSPRGTRRAPISDNWTYLGTSLAPSAGPAFDDLADLDRFGHQGTRRALASVLYRRQQGRGRALPAHRARRHRATCTHWTRVGKDGLCLDLAGPNAGHYEAEHMIGPLARPGHARPLCDAPTRTGDGYLMYFTARAPGIAEPNAAGAIGFATSPDLYDVDAAAAGLCRRFRADGSAARSFEIGGRWYCLFCTSAEHWSRGLSQSQSGKRRSPAPTISWPTIRAVPGALRRARFSMAACLAAAMRGACSKRTAAG